LEDHMRTTTAAVSIAAMLTLTGCAGEPTQQAESKAFVIYFQNGSAELTPDAQRTVAEIASAVKEAERSELTIEGTAARTADAASSSDANVGARRALAVENALRADGVAESAIGLRYTDAAPETKGLAARRVKITLVAEN
jgi:outer membrane protein OmpA-like peptidoglycan-associated protein